MIRRKLLRAVRVRPGRKVDLDDYDAGLEICPEQHEKALAEARRTLEAEGSGE